MEALDAIGHVQPDLIILDVNLPGANGFEVCRQVRAQGVTPILLLTVRSTEEDHVHGLDQGADDYLTKPFSPRTLLAHVRALLRRSGVNHPRTNGTGDLRLDIDDQTVTLRGGEPVRLTNREFRLLQHLCANIGHTVSVEGLTSSIWGHHAAGDRQLLKQIVHRVRQKIEWDPPNPQYIITVPGVGYKLKAEQGAFQNSCEGAASQNDATASEVSETM
jgi:DNA-binding response OmpR family regulator